MRILGICFGIALLAAIGFLLLGDRSPNQYTIEDSLASPDGRFVATRFQESTPFVVCSEIVVVMPAELSFNIQSLDKYAPYTAFADDCSVEVRTRWNGGSALEISSTMNRSEERASENWKTSPLASEVTLSFRRISRP